MKPLVPGSRGGERASEEPILRRLFGRRKELAQPRPEAPLIAVASGKGGTGKSFLCTNLGVVLARRQRNVTLVDADFGMGNAHLLLGVKPRRTIQHVLSGDSPLDDALVDTGFGFDLLPAGSGVHRLADLSDSEVAVLGESLGCLAATRDLLLLDAGAGMAPQVLAMLLAAHHIVLVTQPELAALTDAYALIKCLTGLGAAASIHVVVNRVSRPGLGALTFSRLSQVAERFCDRPLHYLGEVPEDPAVGLRRLGQPPLTVGDPKCATSLALEDVAEKILNFEGVARTGDPGETTHRMAVGPSGRGGLASRLAMHRLRAH